MPNTIRVDLRTGIHPSLHFHISFSVKRIRNANCTACDLAATISAQELPQATKGDEIHVALAIASCSKPTPSALALKS
jgi:hypothetical protein